MINRNENKLFPGKLYRIPFFVQEWFYDINGGNPQKYISSKDILMFLGEENHGGRVYYRFIHYDKKLGMMNGLVTFWAKFIQVNQREQ